MPFYRGNGVAWVLEGGKEEETKTLEPDFSDGNQVITPTSGKVLSQVTLTKPTDLIPENIAKDKNICGVVGTLESGGGFSGEEVVGIAGEDLSKGDIVGLFNEPNLIQNLTNFDITGRFILITVINTTKWKTT